MNIGDIFPDVRHSNEVERVMQCQLEMTFIRTLLFVLCVSSFLFILYSLTVLEWHNELSSICNSFRAERLHPKVETSPFSKLDINVSRRADNAIHNALDIPNDLFTANLCNQLSTKHFSDINSSDIATIRRKMFCANREQMFYNLAPNGISFTSYTIVILVQVHDRLEYFRFLISSLSKVIGIENAILIFSHDVFSTSHNLLINNITFCPVLQIFFPFSQQISKNTFPSHHWNDCPRNMKKEEAISKNCNNAHFPDTYGHYREAEFCQVKHHWIWKLQFVFEDLRVLRNYDGYVLLLEDDYYVSKDVLFALHKMHYVLHRDCSNCNMLVLGNYDKIPNYETHAQSVTQSFWISSKHNMGMAFKRQLWLDIKKCGLEFCTYDDYNWDWTLQYISMNCFSNKIRVVQAVATRVFHIGDCGIHTKSKKCDVKDTVQRIETLISQNGLHLFPDSVSLAGTFVTEVMKMLPNGGWGDIRDHKLCALLINNSYAHYGSYK